MENRVQLSIMGISYSQLQQGAYAIILGEVDGLRRIPVVIGANEAQSIAIKLEGIVPPRPLTHDLFVSFAHAFGVSLREVFIYKFEDGIFYSELTFSDGSRQVVIDSRTSDAIAIAVRAKAPIFTTSEIIRETGFVIEQELNEQRADDEDEILRQRRQASDDVFSNEPKLENFAIEELERTLEQLIAHEEYEEAAKVKRLIEEKKKKRENPGGSTESTTPDFEL